jgi:hypothetical protein
MSAKEILSLVGAEIANLQQARALIIGTGTKKLGQPKSVVVPEDRPKKKRTMSPEGRARIAAAMKARWAAKKKAAK